MINFNFRKKEEKAAITHSTLTAGQIKSFEASSRKVIEGKMLRM
jgi:hypothetical protein